MLLLELTAHNSTSLSYKNTGLGNVLYQLAFQYSFCRKHNILSNYFLIKKFIEKLQKLGLKKNNIFNNFITDDLELKPDIELKEENFCLFDCKLINKILENKDKNILIKDSYLQSHIYFHDFEEDIQNLFGPDKEFLNTIQNKHPKLFDNDETNICVQMRLDWSHNVLLDVNFIFACLKYFESKNLLKKKINLWVFSDNFTKAKELLSSYDKIDILNIIYVSDNLYDYEDLWTMSLIDYHILCFSTFSWWGAYLNKNKNKVVLYSNDYYYTFYKKILEKNEPYRLIIDNIYPKNWVCVNMNYMKLI